MAQADINARVAQILGQHGQQHGQHRQVAVTVNEHGQRLDNVETRVGEILDEGGRLDQTDAAIERVAVDFGNHRERTNRRLFALEGELTDWGMVGIISVIAGVVGLLFGWFAIWGADFNPWIVHPDTVSFDEARSQAGIIPVIHLLAWSAFCGIIAAIVASFVCRQRQPVEVVQTQPTAPQPPQQAPAPAPVPAPQPVVQNPAPQPDPTLQAPTPVPTQQPVG